MLKRLSGILVIAAIGVICMGGLDAFDGRDMGTSEGNIIEKEWQFANNTTRGPFGIPIPQTPPKSNVIEVKYHYIQHMYEVGPVRRVNWGDTDPECGIVHWAPGKSTTINAPSNCANFCVDHLDQAAYPIVEFAMKEENGSDEWSCRDQTVCQFSYSSVHKNGYACAEFRNWSGDRTRIFIIRALRRS